MAQFDIGETVICSVEIKDSTGAYKAPSTSIKITIADRFNSVKVNAVDMNPDGTGKYHYDCQTVGYLEGTYTVKYIATDGTRITIERETFELK